MVLAGFVNDSSGAKVHLQGSSMIVAEHKCTCSVRQMIVAEHNCAQVVRRPTPSPHLGRCHDAGGGGGGGGGAVTLLFCCACVRACVRACSHMRRGGVVGWG